MIGDFVSIDEFILQPIDLSIEFIFTSLELLDFLAETIDLNAGTLFRDLEFRDLGLHEVVDEFEFHDSTAELFVGLTEVIELIDMDMVRVMVVRTLAFGGDDRSAGTIVGRRGMTRGFDIVDWWELWRVVSGRRRLT